MTPSRQVAGLSGSKTDQDPLELIRVEESHRRNWAAKEEEPTEQEVADDDCKILPGVPQHLRTYVPVTDYLNLGDLIHHLPFPRVHASPQHTPTHSRDIPTSSRRPSPPNTHDLQLRRPRLQEPPTYTRFGQPSERTPFTPSYSPNSVLNIANPSHCIRAARRQLAPRLT
ncbi:hypothetical protein CSIM01_06853 [Colletotrichum simmondsii]|uniref:Uncharacterized protein n=1 Tax=Colletotrichum simmondsii TaxID=703756 RepID=A0A135TFA3_9PEZI|nr:hypothetical protein CSIM01_06853 [Colletotrichum simmondsii]